MLMEPRTEILPRLAAEAGTVYAAVPDRPAAGLLDHMAALADRRDRDMGELVRCLVSAHTSDDVAELTGGMSLQVWLQREARCMRGEAREILGAVDVLRAMPATLVGLSDRWLSWSQTSAICRAARRVPVGRRGELDDLVGGAMLRPRAGNPTRSWQDMWDWVDPAAAVAVGAGRGRPPAATGS